MLHNTFKMQCIKSKTSLLLSFTVLFMLFLGLFSCTSTKIKPYHKQGYVAIDDSTLHHSSMNRLIEPYQKELKDKMNEVIAICDTPMPRLKTEPETLLGNFTADLVYKYGKNKDLNIDMCILNFGGLRTSLPKGKITVGKIFELMPFENELVLVELSHEEMLELGSYLAQKGGQPISNASITIEDSITFRLNINGRELTSNKTYHVITTDYLANGGDKMYFLQNPISYTLLDIKLRDVIIEHCRNLTQKNEHLTSSIQNRVVFKTK